MIKKELFGKRENGEEVYKFTLQKDNLIVCVLDYGATIQSIKTPDKNGNFVDVALGYNTLSEYENNDGYLGASIGRCCNRIANGKFSLNGKNYELYKNDGVNHLHGGKIGFDKYIWQSEYDDEVLTLRHVSPDGDEGYDGELNVELKIYIDDERGLNLEYYAIGSKPTLCNLTNHVYFNLDGEGSGDILSTNVKIFADSIAAMNDDFVPDGTVMRVGGTPFDFRDYHTIGERINEDNRQLNIGVGYDHAFILRKNPENLAAVCYSEKSGILLSMNTSSESIQFYTGNSLNGYKGKSGVYNKRNGFCMEAQAVPNAVNLENFKTPLLLPREQYENVIRYEFALVD